MRLTELRDALAGVLEGTLEGTLDEESGMLRYEAGAFSLLMRSGG